jgi:hypothetical protein
VQMPQWVSRLISVLIPAHHDRTEALRGDLIRLATLAEAQHRPTGKACRGSCQLSTRERKLGRASKAAE